MVLDDRQRELVAGHLHVVEWVIRDYFHVNEHIFGFGRDDLFQEGCLALCKAAMTYDESKARFNTHANTTVRNSLLTYCSRMCRIQKRQVNLMDAPMGSGEDGSGTFGETFADEAAAGALLSSIEAMSALETMKQRFSGVARLGVEALEMRARGHTVADIAKLYGVKANHVGAWVSRALQKLRQDKGFMATWL
jgi:RNA polymerase sigma factor (sigma-70 family)